MTTSTTMELEILHKKEAFLWERMEEAVELTTNTNTISFLTTELDKVKARILELETEQYFNELDQEYAKNSNETTDK
jgi:hypothetical protein